MDARLPFFIEARASSTTFVRVFNSIQIAAAAPFSVIRASSSSDADIILHDAKGLLHIRRADSLIGIYANPLIEVSVELNPDCILRILRSAAHFKFYLSRADQVTPLHSAVRVELHQLEESDDGRYVPAGNNLVRNEQALVGFNDKPHGITLFNDSEYNLFPSLFYFDPSNYSIQPWYIPSSSSLSPLRAKSKLTIAHGDRDGQVIKFTLRQNELSDTGFLVLYLSTQYSDMTYIQQDDAFEDSHGHEELVECNKYAAKAGSELWGTILTIITVERSNTLKVAPTSTQSPPRSRSFYSILDLVLGLLVLLTLLSYVFLVYRPFFS